MFTTAGVDVTSTEKVPTRLRSAKRSNTISGSGDKIEFIRNDPVMQRRNWRQADKEGGKWRHSTAKEQLNLGWMASGGLLDHKQEEPSETTSHWNFVLTGPKGLRMSCYAF